MGLKGPWNTLQGLKANGFSRMTNGPSSLHLQTCLPFIGQEGGSFKDGAVCAAWMHAQPWVHG